MSTRACYSFADKHRTLHVYKHCDGYPSGAEQWISKALDFAWKLPRFEADEFAAAFVAANKDRNGGDIRLMQDGNFPGDIEYRYEVSAENGIIFVTAYKVEFDGPSTEIWNGPLSAFQSWAARYENTD